jgi:hypothetical protein
MRICSEVHLRHGVRAVVTALLLTARMLCGQQDHAEAALPGILLTGAQVAIKMEEKNQERARALREFSGSRTYRMEYRGVFGNKDAEMTVQMNFQAPATKSFRVVSQAGSKLIIERVFKKLLQTETEALDEENRRLTALTTENYEFMLVEYEHHAEGDSYVLSVTPRNKNKLLYQGKIWVHAKDFAVTHIEAEPARSPSFWIKQTEIAHDYAKIGDFWLPARNRTVSQIRLGGHAILSIDYTDYRIISVASGQSNNERSAQPERITTGRASELPAPTGFKP